jgi:hypothetical protein
MRELFTRRGRGGGLNGHLAIVMSAPAYLACTGAAFDPPMHPGDAPVHVTGSTAAQIVETNRRFKHELADHRLFRTVSEELKQHVLTAVPVRYLCILEDVDYGYSDVTILEMITHLKTTYCTIEPEEFERNRNALTTAWNPDDPIEELWQRLQEIQRYAIAAGEPITDAAALRLALVVFENTGVFTTAAEKWRDKPADDWTMPNFQDHFTKANKERALKLTAQSAGYHGANSAVTAPPPPSATAATAPGPGVNADGTVFYYCWTHGLGKNRLHTSPFCKHKAGGHKDNATASNMQGGCDRIMTRRRQSPPNADT